MSQYGVVTFVALVAILGRPCGGRDLRPSDHGLSYQGDPSPPPARSGDAQEMLSFFGATTSSPAVEGGRGGGVARDDAGRDHVRLGLVVASGVCGLTGVVLLVVSGVVFVVRLQKQKLKADRIPSTSAPITATKS
ncbi:hypothetical protein PHJA_001739700 [Phtheirospermum japonicum]|uniref:Uncharacterized protein n=1 Tax=Phtheirospermum japonicum TaxID=374723 RepID=A0A830C9V6_9LAMI|nr:hypothetical protein PHJA_001739700 [Phtheirospermum japonicum]